MNDNPNNSKAFVFTDAAGDVIAVASTILRCKVISGCLGSSGIEFKVCAAPVDADAIKSIRRNP